MSIFTSAQAFQQTRHARRLYVGGIPPNYTDEEELKAFLNMIISKGLNVENDNSFVLSIYINQKKCFAFIELRSIELATACLNLDGLLFKKVMLKVLRANEYKPELIPPSLAGKPVQLDLPSFYFGSAGAPPSRPQSHEFKASENKIESIVKFVNLSAVETGAVVVVGYPYDGANQRDSLPKVSPAGGATTVLASKGCASTPRSLRNQMKKFKFGALDNPEFGIDMTHQKIFDVGDVAAGKSADDAPTYLSLAIYEIARLGGISFVVGGSQEMFSPVALGLHKAWTSGSGLGLGVVTISAHMRDLSPSETSPSLLEEPGITHVRFAVQGSMCSHSVVSQVLNANGKVVWLSKDLRGVTLPALAPRVSSPVRTTDAFREALEHAKQGKQPITVALSMSAVCSSVGGASLTGCGPQGLTMDEVLDLALIAGSDPNVVCFQIADFHPESDDTRNNLLLSELFYRFNLGAAARTSAFSLSQVKAFGGEEMRGGMHVPTDLLSFALYMPSIPASVSPSPAAYSPPPPSLMGGTDSSRSSLSAVPLASNQYTSPVNSDRSSVRPLPIHPSSGVPMRMPSAAGDSSARSSVRLSVGSVAFSDEAGSSRPNSLGNYARFSDAPAFPGAYEDGEADTPKHYHRRVDSFRVEGVPDALHMGGYMPSPSQPFSDNLESLDSLLQLKDSRPNSGLYGSSFANAPVPSPSYDQQRRSGFRLSSTQFPQSIHPVGRVLHRTLSGISGTSAASDNDSEYHSPPNNYTHTPGIAHGDGSLTTDGDVLTNWRGGFMPEASSGGNPFWKQR